MTETTVAIASESAPVATPVATPVDVAVDVAVKPKKNIYASRTYFEMIGEAEKSVNDRRNLPVGRGQSEVIVRRHHLLTEDIDVLKDQAKEGDNFPNPFNRGSYHFLLEAIKKARAFTTAEKGVSRLSFARLYDSFKELTSDASTKDDNGKTLWQRFKGKDARNNETGRDEEGRLLQNLEVMQRVTGRNCYGLKIDQVAKAVLGLKGACIDISRFGGEIFVSLNLSPTEFVEVKANEKRLPVGYKVNSAGNVKIARPANETKRRRGAEDEKPKAKAKVKAPKAPKAETVTDGIAGVTVVAKAPRARKAPKVDAPAVETAPETTVSTPVEVGTELVTA